MGQLSRAEVDRPKPLGPLSALNDEDALVERIASGDEAAFRALYVAFYSALCDFVVSYVHAPDIAEEIVQAKLYRVWELRRTWEPSGGVRASLFAACRNAAIDHLRREAVRARVSTESLATGEIPGLAQAPANPDVALDASEVRRELRAALAELSERRRTVVILRWQHRLGPTEIARVMQITVKGVESHMARALADLRKRLVHLKM
jgi:RNA polymerase sigma-70 factor (family 1)